MPNSSQNEIFLNENVAMSTQQARDDNSWGFKKFFEAIGEMVIRLKSKVSYYNYDNHMARQDGGSHPKDDDQVNGDCASADDTDLYFVPDPLKRRRKRPNSFAGLGEKDMDSLLSYHSLAQDGIAENLLHLAKAIKQQSILAGNIVREDTKNLEKAKLMADRNITDLNENCSKLQRETQSNWQLWIWVLLFVVFAVFILMVFLMKVMKKQ